MNRPTLFRVLSRIGARRALLTLPALAAALAFSLSAAGPASVAASPSSATYQYLVGAGALCSLSPDFCPEVSGAPNGDTVSVTGQGTFTVHGGATGGGTFIHKNASGGVLATGTWTALSTVSFKSFGISPDLEAVLPAGSTGGQVLLRVHISPDAGGPGFDALMTIICDLESNPPGKLESLRLVVPGIINFNKHVSGANIFIKQ